MSDRSFLRRFAEFLTTNNLTGKSIFVLLLLLFMGTGCGPHVNRASKYGVEANAVREQVGLPILPAGWVLYGGAHGSTLGWYNPDRNALLAQGKPCRSSTGVEVLGDQIKSEEDTYWSGRMIHVDETDMEEMMVITYSFDLAKQGKDPWHCLIFGGPQDGHYNKTEADRILKTWGISTSSQ